MSATIVPPLPAGSRGACEQLRRDLGAFYTPTHTVEHMVGSLAGLDAGSRVLEPSGGDGAFVTGLLEHTGVSPDQVEVWDLDEAVGDIFTRSGVTFAHRDSLLEAPPAAEGRYTHIVGNPPYLNKQSAYIKANKAKLRRAYSQIGANDTYAMFIYMAMERLAPGGQLVFLVSDTFLTLGIHRKLREYLLAGGRIDTITLLPPKTFADAAVKTAILNVTRAPAPDDHQVEFVDLRAENVGDYTGGARHRVPQAELATNPGSVFAFDPAQREVLTVLARCRPLVELLDGGLGMHTGDNGAYLGVVERDGHLLVKPQAGMPSVACDDVDGQAWRFYHKRGGAARWWQPAEHCVRWDAESRRHYGTPGTALIGLTADGEPRPGFVVSGICARLTARIGTAGALWESNKAFCLFPKDPATWPVEFFVAILNSAWYNTVAQSLNHTVSLQTRDLQTLPLLPFTPDEVTTLTALGSAAIEHVQRGGTGEPDEQGHIDQIVRAAAARALSTARN